MIGSLLAGLFVVFATNGAPVFATFDQDQIAGSVDHATSAYTQELHGAQAEHYRARLSDLSYSNGVVLDAGVPVPLELPAMSGWPILSDHPAPLPAGGYSYRLREGSNLTWWVARDADQIATQISAHNDRGDDIRRSINLRTGVETIINETERDQAATFPQFRAARQVKTNAAVRARAERQEKRP